MVKVYNKNSSTDWSYFAQRDKEQYVFDISYFLDMVKTKHDIDAKLIFRLLGLENFYPENPKNPTKYICYTIYRTDNAMTVEEVKRKLTNTLNNIHSTINIVEEYQLL